MWILNCFTPYPMLANAHSFKDKTNTLSDVNSGLFTYPVLMAADILLYDANIVPVGKDQLQHLEMTRDIAGSFNHLMGETFVIPEAKTEESVMIIPGTDGKKMSKSYGNTINIFSEEILLKKQVMQVVTDSIPLEEPKDPNQCNVFNIYKLLANNQDIQRFTGNIVHIYLEIIIKKQLDIDIILSNKLGYIESLFIAQNSIQFIIIAHVTYVKKIK